MKWLVLFCAVAGFSENIYQRHLPEQIYQVLSEQEFFDADRLENRIERHNGASVDTLTVSTVIQEKEGRRAGAVGRLRGILQGEESRRVVIVDFWCGEAVDDFRGIQVGYREGRVLEFSIFDGEGLGYVALPPFSRKEEKETAFNLQALIEGGYQKLKEVYGQ